MVVPATLVMVPATLVMVPALVVMVPAMVDCLFDRLFDPDSILCRRYERRGSAGARHQQQPATRNRSAT